MKYLLVGSVLVLASISVHAAPRISGMNPAQHASKFCHLADDLGYRSDDFKHDTMGCASQYVELRSKQAAALNETSLAFYVQANPERGDVLESVQVEAHVYNTSKDAGRAHAELARVAKALSTRLTSSVPTELQKTILDGGSKSWPAGLWLVSVKTSAWPTKRGHDVLVTFQPAK